MKKFKDPIYGYIEIDDSLCSSIIDTATFQRLKNIRQTSYLALYPCSLHNRFSHSLGVYYLGTIGLNNFLKNTKENYKKDYRGITVQQEKQISRTFLLACLLHDVGHTPFSHICEDQFKDTEMDDIIAIIDNENFNKDLERLVNKPKTHEMLSVLVSIKKFPDIINKNKIDLEFFARAILGIPYHSAIHGELSFEQQIKCALVHLLASDTIDVDKLDYLMRDSYVAGFNFAQLDYNRLLAGMILCSFNNEAYLGYKLSALSIIDNVLQAIEFEKSWVQLDAVIKYDNNLVKQMATRFKNFCDDQYPNTNIMHLDFLTDGRGDIPFKRLCDDDIISTVKNCCYDDIFVEQWFDRNKRLHPIYKNHAEASTIFGSKIDDYKDDFYRGASNLCNQLETEWGCFAYLNNDSMAKISPDSKSAYKLAKIFQDFSSKNNLDFEYAFIGYNLGTSKIDSSTLKKIMIYSEEAPVKSYQDIINRVTINANLVSSTPQSGYFIYTTKQNIDGDRKKFAVKLAKAICSAYSK